MLDELVICKISFGKQPNEGKFLSWNSNEIAVIAKTSVDGQLMVKIDLDCNIKLQQKWWSIFILNGTFNVHFLN